ncbi:MAG: hypothetical protein Q4G67_04630 [Actinomycetia bacterium]|nr:hypothetical protein [Actinomycetes bacterium]
MTTPAPAPSSNAARVLAEKREDQLDTWRVSGVATLLALGILAAVLGGGLP